MKPALSVIFFTVTSGAGLGLLIWLALAVLAGAALNPAAFSRGMLLAVVLVTAGLLSSTGHLANPRNAWHVFRRIGSSWLSREAVLAVLLYPAIAWFALEVLQTGARRPLAAALLVVLAASVLLSTVMIYACLRTVPHWHNWQTRIGMPLYGLMSGGVLLLADWPLRLVDRPIQLTVLALLVLGLIIKYHYYTSFRHMSDAAPGINEALKLGLDPNTHAVNARVRLLDVGHTHGTFLTREFGYELPRDRALRLRLLALALAFVVPFLIVLYWRSNAWLAAALCLAGLLVERWLFFAEARHVVRHYHGMSMQ